MRVIQEQNATLLQLLANHLATSEKQYKQPPAYICGILLENSTLEQVSDWLVAIQAGNRLQPTTSESHYIEWALTKVTPSLQTQWRNHQFTLNVMGDNVSLWATFEAFVRRSHINPELQERRLYGQLHKAHQKDQSPLRFFAEWSAIYQALGTKDLEENRPLAFLFFYCLQPGL
ncbi:hypothetical protein LY78DRAFT_687701 [Colletotrichum sublineola]|nr:hypothetical protein LY78DRAFT_687701 [Colletotrichum sublineola]